MPFTGKASTKYSLLPDSDSPTPTTSEKPLRSRLTRSSYALIAVLLVSSVLISALLLTPKPRSTCTQPRRRQEWRTLTQNEKQSYLAAAHCLTTTPSSPLSNATIHDEFSLLHSRVGNYCNSLLSIYALYIAANTASPQRRLFSPLASVLYSRL
jgi:tyrosinase